MNASVVQSRIGMRGHGFFIALLIILLLAVDTAVKIAVKTTMTLGESIRVFNWFYIVFIENPGMAFGLSIGNKWILTLFRIVVACVVGYYIVQLVRMRYKVCYTVVVALVFAGAVGNIIDCMFYGVLFGESTPVSVAQWMPESGGYASLLCGNVVDMFYFPLFTFPNWMPLLGGEIFFSPIFNVADACITVGIFLLFIFFRHEFNETFGQVFSKKSQHTTSSQSAA